MDDCKRWPETAVTIILRAMPYLLVSKAQAHPLLYAIVCFVTTSRRFIKKSPSCCVNLQQFISIQCRWKCVIRMFSSLCFVDDGNGGPSSSKNQKNQVNKWNIKHEYLCYKPKSHIVSLAFTHHFPLHNIHVTLHFIHPIVLCALNCKCILVLFNV